jgi:hypothetical protein
MLPRQVPRDASLVGLPGVIALLLTSCNYPIYIHGFVKPEGPYGDVIARTTRYATALRNPDEMIYVFATIESPEFLEARTQRLAQAIRVPVTEAGRYGGDVTMPLEGIVFFVSVHTADSGANDLDMASSRWSLHLQGPDGIVSPTVVKRIHSSYPAVEALYPYLDRAYASYRVAFPGPFRPGAGYTLLIAGSREQVRLVFNDAR